MVVVPANEMRWEIRPRRSAAYDGGMKRLGKFEHNRYVGDKRSQVVYDIDELASEDEPLIAELLAAETFLCFGPDTLAEARNRGYHLFRKQRRAAAAAAVAAD